MLIKDSNKHMYEQTYVHIYVHVCECVFIFTVAQASTCSMPRQESRVGDGGRGPTETCHNISEFMSAICKPFTQLDPAQFFEPASGFFLLRFLGVFLFLFYWHCPKMRCAILTRLAERCLVSLSAGKNRMVHTHFGASR